MRAITRFILTGAAAAAALGSAPLGDGSAGDTFALGVLRRDGVVIPFAQYNGKRWSSSWPLPNRDLLVPLSLSAVPKSWWGRSGPIREWQAVTDNGTRTVRVVGPDAIDVGCVRQVALRTDYVPFEPPPPPVEHPYPKDGLAIAPARAMDRIEILPADGSDAVALVRPVTTAFNSKEREFDSGSGHPIPRRLREAIAPTIEAVYAYGSVPRVYYVEASRAYRQSEDATAECAAVAFASGWFIHDDAGIRATRMDLTLMPCDREAASYMLPLAALRVSTQVFWVVQFSGWDDEHFDVIEPKPKAVDVALKVWGGGCS